jgi:hypothetical protein
MPIDHSFCELSIIVAVHVLTLGFELTRCVYVRVHFRFPPTHDACMHNRTFINIGILSTSFRESASDVMTAMRDSVSLGAFGVWLGDVWSLSRSFAVQRLSPLLVGWSCGGLSRLCMILSFCLAVWVVWRLLSRDLLLRLAINTQKWKVGRSLAGRAVASSITRLLVTVSLCVCVCIHMCPRRVTLYVCRYAVQYAIMQVPNLLIDMFGTYAVSAETCGFLDW